MKKKRKEGKETRAEAAPTPALLSQIQLDGIVTKIAMPVSALFAPLPITIA